MGSAADSGPSADSADLAALRREYGDAGLDTPDLEPDPVAMFRRWMQDTIDAGLHEPNAMVVATVSAEGRPSARMVLLKAVDERGFVFYTNYESRKGNDLTATRVASLLFPWHDLQRQVRVEGPVERVAAEESQAYFAARPRGSQLGARYADVEERFGEDGEVSLPPFWGGFRVLPELVEFWQGRKGRMHDRLVYRREGASGWRTSRLAP